MWENISVVAQNERNNTKVMKWRCFSNEQETVSLDNAFAINVYLYAFVNALSAIVGLVSNSLVINGVYRNKTMNKVSRTLTILLPIAGLVSSLVIQPLYVSSKIIILLGHSKRSQRQLLRTHNDRCAWDKDICGLFQSSSCWE